MMAAAETKIVNPTSGGISCAQCYGALLQRRLMRTLVLQRTNKHWLMGLTLSTSHFRKRQVAVGYNIPGVAHHNNRPQSNS